jgi:long-subunit fatty acid transport protein
MQKTFKAIAFLIFLTSLTYAQLFPVLGSQRAGISTAQFLKISVGARAVGMADAYVANATDASALYWNPAGLVQFKENQIILSHTEWFVDIKHDFVGSVYHLSRNDAIGLSLTALYTDDMEITTETQPYGTGRYFKYIDLALGLSYARRMTNQFSFGITLKYIEETIDVLKMRGLLFDLGTFYWIGLGTSRFGVSISNFGADLAPKGEVTLLTGEKISNFQSFAPPTMFRFSFAVEPIMNETHKLTTAIQLNHPNDNAENFGIGVEYGFKESFFIRGGYKINADEQNLTFGTGVAVKTGPININIDYAYAKFTRLGNTHRFSIIFKLN